MLFLTIFLAIIAAVLFLLMPVGALPALAGLAAGIGFIVYLASLSDSGMHAAMVLTATLVIGAITHG